jgi:AcrR family transcriptional regulator
MISAAKSTPRRTKRASEPGTIDLDNLPPAGRRILVAASDLFYRHGIGAVGVDTIADEAGTTKKTIYDRFGSKEGLVTAYLQNRTRRWQRYVTDWMENTESTGIERVLEPLRALSTWMTEQDRGCAFINAFAELAGTDHHGLQVITAEKQWVRDLYAGLIAEAGLDEPTARAGWLAIVHEGMIAQVAAGQYPQAADAAIRLARLACEADLSRA